MLARVPGRRAAGCGVDEPEACKDRLTMHWTRRQWLAGTARAVGAGGAAGLGLTGAGAGASGLLAGCGPRSGARGATPPRPQGLAAAERRLLWQSPRPLPVRQWSRQAPDPRSVLRRRAAPARALSAKTLARIDACLRETLARSGGVGLAAPQVGLSRRVVLVQLQREDKPVLTCVEPVCVQRSRAQVDGYEACLSVQGVGGLVRRARQVTVVYRDLQGRTRRIRSSGWEARIFQHELDHLDGVLYLDRLVGPLLPLDEVRRRRERRRERRQESRRDAPLPRIAAGPPARPEPWML
jgi:peptide deformylase